MFKKKDRIVLFLITLLLAYILYKTFIVKEHVIETFDGSEELEFCGRLRSDKEYKILLSNVKFAPVDFKRIIMIKGSSSDTPQILNTSTLTNKDDLNQPSNLYIGIEQVSTTNYKYFIERINGEDKASIIKYFNYEFKFDTEYPEIIITYDNVSKYKIYNGWLYSISDNNIFFNTPSSEFTWDMKAKSSSNFCSVYKRYIDSFELPIIEIGSDSDYKCLDASGTEITDIPEGAIKGGLSKNQNIIYGNNYNNITSMGSGTIVWRLKIYNPDFRDGSAQNAPLPHYTGMQTYVQDQNSILVKSNRTDIANTTNYVGGETVVHYQSDTFKVDHRDLYNGGTFKIKNNVDALQDIYIGTLNLGRNDQGVGLISTYAIRNQSRDEQGNKTDTLDSNITISRDHGFTSHLVKRDILGANSLMSYEFISLNGADIFETVVSFLGYLGIKSTHNTSFKFTNKTTASNISDSIHLFQKPSGCEYEQIDVSAIKAEECVDGFYTPTVVRKYMPKYSSNTDCTETKTLEPIPCTINTGTEGNAVSLSSCIIDNSESAWTLQDDPSHSCDKDGDGLLTQYAPILIPPSNDVVEINTMCKAACEAIKVEGLVTGVSYDQERDVCVRTAKCEITGTQGSDENVDCEITYIGKNDEQCSATGEIRRKYERKKSQSGTGKQCYETIPNGFKEEVDGNNIYITSYCCAEEQITDFEEEHGAFAESDRFYKLIEKYKIIKKTSACPSGDSAEEIEAKIEKSENFTKYVTVDGVEYRTVWAYDKDRFNLVAGGGAIAFGAVAIAVFML